jgi:hypothetical protein
LVSVVSDPERTSAEQKGLTFGLFVFANGLGSRAVDHPNSQDLGRAIGLCSLNAMMPLTMRTSDHTNH